MELRNRMDRGAHFTELVQLLLDAGADVEARRNEHLGETALQMATGALSEGLPEAIFDAVLQAAAEQNGPVPSRRRARVLPGWSSSGFRRGSS